VWHVVLPTARSGLTTAIILGTARGIGETSPVLLTAGFNNITNANPTKGPQVSLPLFAFSSVRAPSNNLISRGFGAAAFLMMLVLVVSTLARLLGARGRARRTTRQIARTRRASERDVARWAARTGVVVLALGLVGIAVVKPVEPASAANYVP